ncbi:MAG: hypothetical protein WAM28_01495 [Chlamydiales bacterium]
MVSKRGKDLREALQGVLDLYDIKVDHIEDENGNIDHDELIEKTQDRIDELNEKSEEIFKRIGMDKEQLEVYVSDPSNFTKEQWEALEKVKEACENYKKEAKALLEETQFEKKTPPERRKKIPRREGKRKYWIPL